MSTSNENVKHDCSMETKRSKYIASYINVLWDTSVPWNQSFELAPKSFLAVKFWQVENGVC